MVFSCAVCLDFVYDRLQPQQPSSSFSSTSTSSPDLEPVSKQARLSFESNENAASGAGGLTVQEIVNLDPDINYPVVLPDPEPVVSRRKKGPTTRYSSRINSANGQSNDAGSSCATSSSPLEAKLKEILKPIKSDANQIIVTNCGHIFHLACLTRWLDSLATVYSGNCPECKRAIIRSKKFTRIYPNDQEIAPLIEELERAREREETLLQRIEMEKTSKNDYILYREDQFKYQMSLKEDRITDQSQLIKSLQGKLDSYKNGLKKPNFDFNGTIIDLTDDKTKMIIEIDLSSETDDEIQDENDDVTNIPLPQENDNEQEEIVID